MGKRIAILGAGQLAKYLALAARKLHFQVTVVATSDSEPACQDGPFFVAEPWTPELMLRVFRDNDVVTFENEWISDSLLLRVQEAGLLPKMLPRSESMKQVRTKWDQKQFFLKQGYPTSPVIECNHADLKSLESFQQRVSPLSEGVVLKESELAYDGKGVFVFGPQDMAEAHRTAIELNDRKKPWYLEGRIPFKKEVALVFSRSLQGEFVHYPLVEFRSEKGICSTVYVEGVNTGVMAHLEKKAVDIAKDLTQKINWCGTAALEFFCDASDNLLINELAPRVHNSGHFSLSASRTSQFENHIRAISGLPLGSCNTAPFAIMKNLLGTVDSNRAVAPSVYPGIENFWYGKKEIRAGRKMGHLNAFGSLEEREIKTKQIFDCAADWKRQTI